jgi:hypothetical protein
MGLGLLRKIWEANPTDVDARSDYLNPVIRILSKDTAEMNKPEFAGLLKELELTISDNGVFSNLTDKDSAQAQAMVVMYIAKIKIAAGEDPEAVQKYIDSKIAGLWDADFWKESEGDRAILALEVAKAKARLFISKKDSAEFAIKEGFNADRELKIVAENWKTKVNKEQGKEKTISENVQASFILMEKEKNTITQDEAAIAYLCNRFYSDGVLSPLIAEKEKVDGEKQFELNKQNAKDSYDKVFSGKSMPGKGKRKHSTAQGTKGQVKIARSSRPVVSRAKPVVRSLKQTTSAKPKGAEGGTPTGATKSEVIENGSRRYIVNSDGTTKIIAKQKDDGTWEDVK